MNVLCERRRPPPPSPRGPDLTCMTRYVSERGWQLHTDRTTHSTRHRTAANWVTGTNRRKGERRTGERGREVERQEGRQQEGREAEAGRKTAGRKGGREPLRQILLIDSTPSTAAFLFIQLHSRLFNTALLNNSQHNVVFFSFITYSLSIFLPPSPASSCCPLREPLLASSAPAIRKRISLRLLPRGCDGCRC